jgi:hypothetical protein
LLWLARVGFWRPDPDPREAELSSTETSNDREPANAPAE